MRTLIGLAALAIAAPAAADPPPGGDKVDAQSLVLSGVKLIDAHDYLGALAVFKDAYARFPSAKILLNIGTAERLLGRNADAANAYQRYIDAADADPTKAASARAALADLDKLVGHLDITVSPTDAEIQIGDDEWLPAASWKQARVEAGPFTVRARKTGFETAAQSASVEAGQHAKVELALVATPAEAPTPAPPSAGTPLSVDAQPAPPPEPPPSRFAAFALAHFDFPHTGAAAFVGASVNATDLLAIQAAAIIGPTSGGFLGAKLAFLHGTLQPTVEGGFPVFVSDGLRFGVRGAAGLDIKLTRRVAIVVEVGVEHYLNTQMNIASTLFIPALGISGRL
jgi:hypothetical protein